MTSLPLIASAQSAGNTFPSACTQRGRDQSWKHYSPSTGGQPLDDVLEDFARIPSSFYSILGASSFARILAVITRSSK
jgi:hypothetical protein